MKAAQQKAKYVFIISILIAVGVLAAIVSRGTKQDTAGQNCCGTDDYSGIVDTSLTRAFFEEQEIGLPTTVLANEPSGQIVLGSTANLDERWIEVDLSEQKIRAWEGNSLFLESAISSGLPGTPTPQGEFRIWIKLRATKMEGGQGRYYYYLPNVPYVMFFANDQVPNWRGYGLHGTYWHNDFGTQRSHGCVNLPTPIAEQLYHWVTPTLPDGKSVVWASAESPGTRIIIHE